MNNSRFSSAEDFLEDPSFRAAVFEKNLRDVELWDTFLKDNVHLREPADEARKILLSIRGELPEVTQHEIDSSIKKVLTSIRPRRSERISLFPIWQKIAASVILIVAVGWALNNFYNTERSSAVIVQAPGNRMIVVENKSDKQKLVRLPDGSSAMLGTNSTITFISSFNTSQREVHLSGEAFFEVTKNPQWPFFVHANELVTQVVGTSFLISAYPESKTFKVLVKTGKVKLFQKDKQSKALLQNNPAITLVENEKATLDRKEGIFIDGSSDKVEKINAPAFTRSFEFKRKLIPEVFEILELSYNIKIIYDKDVVDKCTLTASLGDEPLQEKLNMITASLDASYEISGDTVRVNSLKPCN